MVEYLKNWMMSPEHVDHPYPTEDEKLRIMSETGIVLKQLTNWFVNNRKRFWKPKVEELRRRQSGDAGLGPGGLVWEAVAEVVASDQEKNNANNDEYDGGGGGGGAGMMIGSSSDSRREGGGGKKRKKHPSHASEDDEAEAAAAVGDDAIARRHAKKARGGGPPSPTP